MANFPRSATSPDLASTGFSQKPACSDSSNSGFYRPAISLTPNDEQGRLFPDPSPSPRTSFNQNDGEQAKIQGMDLAAGNRRVLLHHLRQALRDLASSRESRTASADDAQRILITHGYDSAALGNAAGSLFKGWRAVGWIASKRTSNHARMIRVWKLE